MTFFQQIVLINIQDFFILLWVLNIIFTGTQAYIFQKYVLT